MLYTFSGNLTQIMCIHEYCAVALYHGVRKPGGVIRKCISDIRLFPMLIEHGKTAFQSKSISY